MWTEQFFKIGVVFKRVCGNGSYVKELEQYDKVSCVVLCCVLLGAFFVMLVNIGFECADDTCFQQNTTSYNIT